MKIHWKLDAKNIKILKRFSYNKVFFDSELCDYLIEKIPYVIEDHKYIYIEFDPNRNNIWKNYWTWTFDGFYHSEESVYQGELNIKKIRKTKLKNIELNEN